MGLHTQPLLMWSCRESRIEYSLRGIANNTASGRKHRIATDIDVTYGTGLSAKGNICPGIGGAGNTCLGHNQVPRANVTVMANMYQIIYLGTLTNNR